MSATACRILTDLGLADSDPVHAATQLLRFCTAWDTAVGRRCTELLPPTQARLLARAVSAGTIADVQVVLEHIADLAPIVDEEYQRIRATWSTEN